MLCMYLLAHKQAILERRQWHSPLIFPWREERSTCSCRPRIKGISEHSTSHRKLKMCFMHSLYPLFVLQGGFKVESNCFKPYELTEKTWPLKMTFNFLLSHICVLRKDYTKSDFYARTSSAIQQKKYAWSFTTKVTT